MVDRTVNSVLFQKTLKEISLHLFLGFSPTALRFCHRKLVSSRFPLGTDNVTLLQNEGGTFMQSNGEISA